MIKIEYLDIQSTDVANGIIVNAFSKDKMNNAKESALSRLNIAHTEDTPLNSWLKHLSDINGLEFTRPVHKDIVDAIQDDITIMRFMFWLA